jgi:hypothetical protein
MVGIYTMDRLDMFLKEIGTTSTLRAFGYFIVGISSSDVHLRIILN